jgi:hypothetical protein
MTQPADNTSLTPLDPAAPAAEPDRGARRWGQRLYVLGAVVYVAGIAIALLTAHPTARAAARTGAWAAVILGAGGAGLLWLRRRKATKARTEVRHFD